MGYASGGVSKIEYASFLTGALAYLMNRQRDAVGAMTFDERVRDLLPCSARPGHLKAVLLTLERLTLGAGTDVARPLSDLVQTIRARPGALVSDLHDEPARVIEALKHFRYRGTDVIVFHVLDPHEIDFPFDRAARFRDLETAAEVMAVRPSATPTRPACARSSDLSHRTRAQRHRLLPVADVRPARGRAAVLQTRRKAG